MNQGERAIGEVLRKHPGSASAIFGLFAAELAERGSVRRGWSSCALAAALLKLHACKTAREVLSSDDQAAKQGVASALRYAVSMGQARLEGGGLGSGAEYLEAVAIAILRMREFERDVSRPPEPPQRLTDAVRRPLPDMEEK